MHCPTCHAPLESGDAFCPNCGAKCSAAPPAPEPKKKKKVPVKALAIVLAVLVLGGVAVAAVLTQGFGLLLPKDSLARNWDIIADAPQQKGQIGYVQTFQKKATLVLSDEIHNDDGTGAAAATVQTPDLQAIFDELWAEVSANPGSLSSDDMDSFLQKKLKAKACPMTDAAAIPVELKRTGGKWQIIPNEDFKAAVTGNAGAIYEQFITKLMEQEAAQ